MKNIKSFENFDKIDEASLISPDKSLIRKILGFPIDAISAMIGWLLVNFLHPKYVSKSITEKYLDIYSNIDDIAKSLNINLSKNISVGEKSTIQKVILKIERMKRKYPTIEDLKKAYIDSGLMKTFRNKEYIKRSISEYKPKKMSPNQIFEFLKSEGILPKS